MAGETVLHEVRDGVGIITLNRPDKLNAFTDKMHAELRAAFDALETDDAVRCLLLTGAGRAFCSGQDLSTRKAMLDAGTYDGGAGLEKNYNPLVLRIRRMQTPVICAVNGVAAGAGANLALACDIVFAAESAVFIQSFAKVGLVPDGGGTYHLPRLVGRARAMGLALTAEPLIAAKAEEWGLIWKSVADVDLMDTALQTATRLAAGPAKGLTLTKAAINASAGNDLETQLALEATSQREAGATDDYREGVTAFLERRAPDFKGS